ncbi:helix-turn-helix domain-containing protein [Roseateles sp.]|uniref:helix-turn-helix domain-containing protein n=1 Tax=Roseateles sp. TaxID=1971397 RepID=UPI003BA664DD
MNLHHDITPGRIAHLIAIREAVPGTAARPQRLRLLEAIHRLGHVTTFEASRYLDIYHPPARKRELVKAGYRVITLMRDVITESGKRHRVGLYTLERV